MMNGGSQMRTYWVKYYLNGIYEEEKSIHIFAKNKIEAYDKAVYEIIPEKEGSVPYSAWVASVHYGNNEYRTFNTSSGNPY